MRSDAGMTDVLAYARSRFSTRLPTAYRYTAGHVWMGPAEDGRWRIGFTQFATRMLGEIVEFEFEVKADAAVTVGQAIGWFEGFKAVSDLYCPMAGSFAGHNRTLDTQVELVHKRPYREGWLYAVAGSPPDDALDAEGYARFLDATIDRMTGEG